MINKFEFGKKYKFINKYKSHAFKDIEFECIFANERLAVLEYTRDDGMGDGPKVHTYSEIQAEYAHRNYDEIKELEKISYYVYIDANGVPYILKEEQEGYIARFDMYPETDDGITIDFDVEIFDHEGNSYD